MPGAGRAERRVDARLVGDIGLAEQAADLAGDFLAALALQVEQGRRPRR
jgi:hypothetical protein